MVGHPGASSKTDVRSSAAEAASVSTLPSVRKIVEEPSWDVEKRSGSRIVVIFRGKVSPEFGRDSARRFLEMMGENEVHLVFDVQEVGGYSNQARKHWQNALWPKRKQIASLTVASSSQLTKMGATMFGAFLGVPCHIVGRID